MLQNELYALVRSTLLAGFTARGAGFADVQVRAVYQPKMQGTPSGPQVTLQTISSVRYGAPRRVEVLPTEPGGNFTHREVQWWESTLQIGATARRDPQAPNFLTLPGAMDICKAASDILQSDEGLSALAVQRVRPLRVTVIRNLQWTNESDQYESMPNFDIVLVHPQTVSSSTPPVSVTEPDFGRV